MVEYFIRILFKVAGLVATGFVSQFQHTGQAFDDEDSGFYGTFFTYFLFVLFFFFLFKISKPYNFNFTFFLNFF